MNDIEQAFSNRSSTHPGGMLFEFRLDEVAFISYATRIHFGYGALSSLAQELKHFGFERPLVVTDRNLMEGPLGSRIRQAVPDGVLFVETPPNPTEEAARDAADRYRSSGCKGFVAIGGGSPMDLAKAAALLVTHHEPLANYALANGGLDRIMPGLPPVIAVPTTAGTGSEVARATVMITESGSKLPIGSPHLIPKAAICDPELTLELPPLLTAGTGFDALSHCIECYCSPRINPPAEAIALDGMARVARFIERAVADGADREARWHMLMASLEGGLVFQKGLGGVHALAHPLGELGIHHGTVNAILLPHVLNHNRAFIGSKLAAISGAMGFDDPENLGKNITQLAERTGLPTSLSAAGMSALDIDKIAQKAERDFCNTTNPVRLSADAYKSILRAAMH